MVYVKQETKCVTMPSGIYKKEYAVHPNAKLTIDQLRSIRASLRVHPIPKVAKEYGLSYSAVLRIYNGETYGEIK